MNNNWGKAAGKTKQTKTAESFNRKKTVRNELKQMEFLSALDASWRRFFQARGNSLPHVPNTYVIPYTGQLDDPRGLTPL